MQIGSFDVFASIRSSVVVAHLFGKIARTIRTKMRRADGSDGGLSRINMATYPVRFSGKPRVHVKHARC